MRNQKKVLGLVKAGLFVLKCYKLRYCKTFKLLQPVLSTCIKMMSMRGYFVHQKVQAIPLDW